MSSFTRLAYEKGIVIVKCKGCGACGVIKQTKKGVGKKKWDGLSKVQTNLKIKFVFSMRVLPQKKLHRWMACKYTGALATHTINYIPASPSCMKSWLHLSCMCVSVLEVPARDNSSTELTVHCVYTYCVLLSRVETCRAHLVVTLYFFPKQTWLFVYIQESYICQFSKQII
jgi:hypothetical protein